MTQEMMGFWEAVASAGPYAPNNLHLAPDRQIDDRVTSTDEKLDELRARVACRVR